MHGYFVPNNNKAQSASKSTNSKLYQRYRKLYEAEKREKEQLRDNLTVAKGEIQKLKIHNTELSN